MNDPDLPARPREYDHGDVWQLPGTNWKFQFVPNEEDGACLGCCARNLPGGHRWRLSDPHRHSLCSEFLHCAMGVWKPYNEEAKTAYAVVLMGSTPTPQGDTDGLDI